MKLEKIKEYKGKLNLISGLHIGSGDTAMRIGGADSTVVKHPNTGEPYIPGSSLKGKIRSLLELETGMMTKTEGKVLSCKEYNNTGNNDTGSNTEVDQAKAQVNRIIWLFGASAADNSEKASKIGPTRISFSDCLLSADVDRKKDLFEVKSENSINRIKGTAENPRFIERVVSGLSFDFSISLKVFECDKDRELEECLLHGMALLQRDALGASGSRGYGKIEFVFDDSNLQEEFKKECENSK